MAKRRDIMMRTDPSFKEEWDRIKLERIKRDLDKKMMSDAELTKRCRNAPSWRKFIEELSTMPRREEVR